MAHSLVRVWGKLPFLPGHCSLKNASLAQLGKAGQAIVAGSPPAPFTVPAHRPMGRCAFPVALDNRRGSVTHFNVPKFSPRGGIGVVSSAPTLRATTCLHRSSTPDRKVSRFHLNWLGLGLFGLFLNGSGLGASNPTDAAPGFAQDVRPILESNCGSCHSSQSHRSGLILETVESVLKGGALDGPAVIAGNSADSPLMLRLRGERQPAMPLGGNALSAEEIDLVARWIDGMAVSEEAGGTQQDKPGWPWTELKEPGVPQVRQQDWVANPIDAFILARLEKKELQPAPLASRRALLRRLYFGLIGLPPTPEDMARFLQDSSSEAYSRAVERLLADSRYGERWGRHWLDLVRYADTRGGGLEYPRAHMWRYRDYVIRAFNQDRPYDRFIKEQLAGDAFPAYGEEGRIGASFLTLGVRVERSAAEGRRDVLIDVVDTTGETFLGVTLGCARCHDHKYDPIPTRDYYRLEAFFAPLTFSAKPLKFTQYEAPLQQPDWWKKKSEAWDQVLDERKQAAEAFRAELKKREAPHYTLMSPQDLKDWVVPDLKRMPFAKGDFYTREEKDRLALITRQTARFANPSSPDYYKAMAYLTSDAPLTSAVATYVLKGGNLKLRGDEVKPGFLSAVAGHSKPANLDGLGRSRRKLLAEWIASRDNPLTARVMVNRIWQHHFGQGLVRTASDFGRNGSGTHHQDLLDWLAWQFVEGGWSVKEMHRLILHSSVYRQSVENPENAAFEEIDSANQLLWKRSPIRAEAEVIRDSLMSVSGNLNPVMGGPPFLPAAEDEWQKRSRTWWEPSPQEDRNRRSIYMLQMRSFQLPMMTVFDGPNTSERCAVRNVTTVTSQVFSLFNGAFAHQQAGAMAGRIRQEVGEDVALQVKRAFQLALQRDPDPSEAVDCLAFLQPAPRRLTLTPAALGDSSGAASGLKGQQGSLQELCLVLLNMNEFIYLE